MDPPLIGEKLAGKDLQEKVLPNLNVNAVLFYWRPIDDTSM